MQYKEGREEVQTILSVAAKTNMLYHSLLPALLYARMKNPATGDNRKMLMSNLAPKWN
jgi:hypothetical protein